MFLQDGINLLNQPPNASGPIFFFAYQRICIFDLNSDMGNKTDLLLMIW